MSFTSRRETAILVLCIVSNIGFAAQFQVFPIATTGMPAPGETSIFSSFKDPVINTPDPPSPALDGNSVTFIGFTSSSKRGIYRYDNGVLNVLANEETPVPGATTHLQTFDKPRISGLNVAFSATEVVSANNWQSVIFTAGPQGLTRIATQRGNPSFNTFDAVQIDDKDVAISGRLTNGIQGTYRYRSAIPTPGTPFFLNTYGGALTGSGGTLVFHSNINFVDGIFAANATNQISTLVKIGDRIPGSASVVWQFKPELISAESFDVAFDALDDSYSEMICKKIDGVIKIVARYNQAAPGGGRIFLSAGFRKPQLSLNSGHVAFLSDYDFGNATAIYTDLLGDLQRVIRTGDTIDGKTVIDLWFGSQGLSGNSLAFAARFDDLSQGIFIATVPEPTCFLALASLVFIFPRRRRTEVKSNPPFQFTPRCW